MSGPDEDSDGRVGSGGRGDPGQVGEIVRLLSRRHSTATVLLHHSMAERLRLGPTDHKCLDLLREQGPMTGTQLSAITGITTGGITGVVTRLERAGYLRKERDPDDRRKQVLSVVTERVRELDAVLADAFGPLRRALIEMLGEFDAAQIDAIATFLSRAADQSLRHAALVRTHSRLDSPRGRPQE